MLSVRFQPVSDGTVLVDVVCACGANGLVEKTSGEHSFKHPIRFGSGADTTLQCDRCGREFRLHPQENHLHVTEADRVLFYEGEFYGLSNFASFAVEWRGVLWMSGEHAYQAAKFLNPDIIENIRMTRSAHDAKKVAHAHHVEIIPDWDVVKLAVMEEIVRAKLAQHPYLQRKLYATGNKAIVENSSTDSFWGRGPDWKGENHLGKLWMKLRDELRRRVR